MSRNSQVTAWTYHKNRIARPPTGPAVLKSLVTAVCLCLSGLPIGAETWRVASLEWPPFSGRNLPEGGAGIAVLRAALKSEGIDVQVDYFPWTRAIRVAKDPEYAGFYPSWPEDVGPGFTRSIALFSSPVGFVEPVRKPLVWKQLQDLRGKRIGVVQDYGNTPEFQQLIKDGRIQPEVVIDDLTNVRKVAAGRLDGAFIDLNNLAYFLRHEASGIAPLVQAHARVVDKKLLVLAINNNFQNKQAADIIRRGAARVSSDKIISDYLSKNP